MIKEYKLLESTTVQGLEELVNSYILQGWTLQSGPIVVEGKNEHYRYYQAVIWEK